MVGLMHVCDRLETVRLYVCMRDYVCVCISKFNDILMAKHTQLHDEVFGKQAQKENNKISLLPISSLLLLLSVVFCQTEI